MEAQGLLGTRMQMQEQLHWDEIHMGKEIKICNFLFPETY